MTEASALPRIMELYIDVPDTEVSIFNVDANVTFSMSMYINARDTSSMWISVSLFAFIFFYITADLRYMD